MTLLDALDQANQLTGLVIDYLTQKTGNKIEFKDKELDEYIHELRMRYRYQLKNCNLLLVHAERGENGIVKRTIYGEAEVRDVTSVKRFLWYEIPIYGTRVIPTHFEEELSEGTIIGTPKSAYVNIKAYKDDITGEDYINWFVHNNFILKKFRNNGVQIPIEGNNYRMSFGNCPSVPFDIVHSLDEAVEKLKPVLNYLTY